MKSLEARALFWSVIASAILVPASTIIVRALIDQQAVGETLIGSLFATAFMGSTALVALLFRDRDLKTAVLYSYVMKISVLASGAVLLPVADLDRRAFGVAVVVSAIIYLAVQLAILSRAPRAKGTPIPFDE